MPSAKAAAAIKASLGRLYGAEVEVSFFDAGDPRVAAEHATLLEELWIEGLPLPVVLLDGVVVFAGAINPLLVVAAVAEARQRRLATRGGEL